jgi:ABC-type bacteriocin/lantibiotic exporter with double-glycine peptidase domain
MAEISSKTKWMRFKEILALDKEAISQLYVFAILSGLLSLSLPLGIQSVIQYVQSGQVVTSWVVLVLLVIIGVILTGSLQVLNLRLTENLQQKIFVYFTFDFAYRFPRLNRLALKDKIPFELMNRFFDIMVIQKGIAKLLLDFTQAFLQITFSLLVLSFYHPFYIGFSAMLVTIIYLVFRPIVKKGLKTSYEESTHKYKTVFWLQEVARADWSFRLVPKAKLNLERLDKHSVDYLTSRTNHFAVLRSQYIWMIALKALIVAALLGLGGYLVIDRQLSLGQFVAAEVLILLILSSVEKLTQLLETFYDVFTSLEKLGQIQDLPMTYEGDPKDKLAKEPIFPIEVIDVSSSDLTILFQIEEGCHTFIHASNQLKTDAFLRLIIDPTVSKSKMPRWNFMVPKPERLFAHIDQFGWFSKGVHLIDGTLYENVIFGRNELTVDDFTKAMECVGLSYLNDKFQDGREVLLTKANKLLSEEERERILIARGIVSSPQLFIISFFGLSLTVEDQIQILNNIENLFPKTTILCASKNLTHNHWNQFDLN